MLLNILIVRWFPLNSEEIIHFEDTLLSPVYQKFPIVLEKGNGCYVWDLDGKQYLDLMGGYGVSLVGHSNEKVVEAI